MLVRGSYDEEAYADDLAAFFEIDIPQRWSVFSAARRAEFLAGRVAARHAMEQLGVTGAQVPVGKSRQPLWPRGISGSITHSHGKVACLASNTPGMIVGIDIEKIMSVGASEQIAGRFCNLREISVLRPAVDPVEVRRTIIFSAKEALFKALFQLMERPCNFGAAEITKLASRDVLVIRMLETLGARVREGDEYRVRFVVEEDYVTTSTKQLVKD